MTYISLYRCMASVTIYYVLKNLFIVSLQLERVYQPELMMFAILLTFGSILYALSDFLKTVALCLKLKGPPVIPFLGNVLLLQDKNCKCSFRIKEHELLLVTLQKLQTKESFECLIFKY